MYIHMHRAHVQQHIGSGNCHTHRQMVRNIQIQGTVMCVALHMHGTAMSQLTKELVAIFVRVEVEGHAHL